MDDVFGFVCHIEVIDVDFMVDVILVDLCFMDEVDDMF